MFRASITVDCIYKSARKCGLIEEGVIGTKEIIAITNGAMVVDLVLAETKNGDGWWGRGIRLGILSMRVE